MTSRRPLNSEDLVFAMFSWILMHHGLFDQRIRRRERTEMLQKAFACILLDSFSLQSAEKRRKASKEKATMRQE
jgi:hypothetical protein